MAEFDQAVDSVDSALDFSELFEIAERSQKIARRIFEHIRDIEDF
jgi:hypothetical protein